MKEASERWLSQPGGEGLAKGRPTTVEAWNREADEQGVNTGTHPIIPLTILLSLLVILL